MTTGPQCGSPAGYAQHRRRDQDTCNDCRTAYTAYNRPFVLANARAQATLAAEHSTEYAVLSAIEAQQHGDGAAAARRRARSILARQYPNRYQQLYVDHLTQIQATRKEARR